MKTYANCNPLDNEYRNVGEVRHIKGHVKVGGMLIPATMDVSRNGSYIIRTEAGTVHTGLIEDFKSAI